MIESGTGTLRPGTGASATGPASATRADSRLAVRARYEREVAALDLADAEQAHCQAVHQAERAAELYASSEAHRRRAERLEAGDTSVLAEGLAVAPRLVDGHAS